MPEYLATVPNDPYGDAQNVPLKYRALKGGSEYLLYSIGINQQDDDGKIHDFIYEHAALVSSRDEVGDLNFRESVRQRRLEREVEEESERLKDELGYELEDASAKND